jgi:Bacterial Ig-like domain (group 3)/Divergent InlB B-repeat domain
MKRLGTGAWTRFVMLLALVFPALANSQSPWLTAASGEYCAGPHSFTICGNPNNPQKCSDTNTSYSVPILDIDPSEKTGRQALFPSVQVNKCSCPPNPESTNGTPVPFYAVQDVIDSAGKSWGAGCTSVGSVRTDTINALLSLVNEYGQFVILTGGSEDGHTELGPDDNDCKSCPFRHDNGFKVDIVDTNGQVNGLSSFITSNFDSLGDRGSCSIWGMSLTSSPPGPQFALEGPCAKADVHWDIVFPSPPPSDSNLSVNTSGTGSGLVLSAIGSNPIINCISGSSTLCSASLTRGINLVLNALPDDMSVFNGWTGDLSGQEPTNPTLLLQMKADTNITAEFDPVPPPPPGNDGCWKWVPTLGGLGGYEWTCTGPPPSGGGAQPLEGCWHWDSSAGVHGAWIRDICGGGCGLNLTTGLPIVTCPPGGGFAGQIITPGDPNDKGGTQGAGPKQYVSAETPLVYPIFYSNEADASASAQTVLITDPLNPDLVDLSTFSFGPIYIAGQTLIPPQGTAYATTVDLRPGNNLLVGVDARLDLKTGGVTWKFTSIDPSTGLPTTNPTVGFLPPGATGSVFFTVMPKQGLATETQVQNQATVVFDALSPIATPTWLNTVDATAPSSHVQPLPSTVTDNFAVQWLGTDVGSGIQGYTIYVSVDGAAFTAWLTNTTSASATFAGQAGHTYGFYSIAIDEVGNVEPMKTSPEASTEVVLLATKTTVQSSSISPPAGQSVTLTATVSGPTGTAIIPTGTVTFLSGATTLGTATLNTSGVATLTTPLPGGTDSITAQYSGDANFASSTSSPISVTVAKISTSAIVASSATAVLSGQSVTLTATVAGPTGTATIPTGTVTFLSGTTTLGTATLNASGVATLPTPLPDGTDSITAQYSGDANFASSTSSPVSVTVSKISTSTTVASSAVTVLPGQSVTLTAAVAGPAGTTTIPTGTVTFLSGTNTLGTATLNTSGVATQTTALPVGTDSIAAQYSGDTNFAPSTSNPVTVIVTAIATSTTVVSSGATANLGANITFTAKVTPATGTAAPTGTVTFSDGSTALGTASLDNSSTALYSTASLAAGSHSISVIYAGDANYSGSTSSALTQIVVAPGYSLSVTPSALTIAHGQPAQAKFTVTPVGGFMSQVTFACSGLPGHSTCTFSPASVTPDGTNTPVASTLTIATDVSTAAAAFKGAPGKHPGAGRERFLALLIVGLPGLIWARHKLGKGCGVCRLALIYGIVLGIASSAMLSCGGGGGGMSTNTPTGTSTITITASGGGTTQTANFTLTVQ